MTLCFMVCEHLHADMTAAAQAQGLTGIELRSFPARCGGPPLTAEELTELAAQSDAEAKEFLGCGCLGQNIDIPGCRIRRMNQCFHLLISPTLADALQRSGACLLTSGWLACWRKELKEEKGFGVFWNKLILIDTKADQTAEQHLTELAAHLNLPVEILPVGLGYAGLFLAAAAGEHRREELERREEESRRQAAEAAMTLDMLGLVVKAASEAEVLHGIEELFRMLFAPKAIHCLSVLKGRLTADRLAVLTPEERKRAELFLQSEQQHELTASGDGFLLRLGIDGVTSVLVLVRQVAFPRHLHSYLNTALNAAGVCSLAVEHVRTLKKLLDTSRLAGKAEVATEVLHNVGNTFNSISVASERLREMLRQSGCVTLPPIIKLLEEHQEDLGAFFNADPKGQKLPRYFASLSGRLMQERELMLEEVGHQLRHIRRAAEIIRTQQDTARGKGFIELLDLPAALEESLDIFSKKIIERQIIVMRDYAVLPPIRGERHKILQIVGNLISNAAEALDGVKEREKKITLRLYPAGGSGSGNGAVLEVEDNGKGISKTFIERIFQFGFSGREGGHGFGLHNAANLAAEMGGSLHAESAGQDKGALFRLLLPTVAGRRRQ